MFVKRHLHQELEVELIKWIVVLVMAAALALLAVSTAAGAEADRSTLVDEGSGVATELFQRLGDTPALSSSGQQQDAKDVYTAMLRLNEAIEALRDGDCPANAAELWTSAPLSPNAEVWRSVALGVAQLRSADLTHAAQALRTAEQLEPENPVVHYYKGLLRLEQAARAHEWNDSRGWRVVAVSDPPDASSPESPSQNDVAPNSRSMYEFVAMAEFEEAIRTAPWLRWNQQLGPVECAMPSGCDLAMPLVSPTVYDLLVALDADNFEAKSHSILGGMYLDRDSLRMAEQHFDAAVGLGHAVILEYRDLGGAYERQDRHLDAARAYFKSLTQGDEAAQATKKVWLNLCAALLDQLK